MIVGISGLAGTGKDTVADCLVKNHGFVKVGLADPLKRICKEVFDFTDDQLYGPSEMRNEPDKRYLRGTSKDRLEVIQQLHRHGKVSDNVLRLEYEKADYLTPRYALQTLGTEWGRGCYNDVWVEYAVRVAERITGTELLMYDPTMGLIPQGLKVPEPIAGVVISDVRFKNEIEGLRKAGAKLIRVKRPGFEKPQWDHPSETEQVEIPDEAFDTVLLNDRTKGELADTVALVLEHLM